jgi:hypothetical protein
LKNFLLYTIKILALVLVLLWGWDKLYTIVYRNSIPRDKFSFAYKTKDQNFDAVFLGSSRVDNHIDPLYFKKLSGMRALNLGMQGSTLADNLFAFKTLIRNNKVKALYLQVDINFFWSGSTDAVLAQSAPFIGDTLVDNFYEIYIKRSGIYFPFNRYAVFGPKIGFREMLFSLANKKPEGDPEKDFARLTQSGKASIERMEEKEYASSQEWKPNPLIGEFIKICSENDTKLYLFMAPVCRKENTIAFVQNLKRFIPGLLDFSRGYPDELFKDCGHLNEKGAEKFTKDLYLATSASLTSNTP